MGDSRTDTNNRYEHAPTCPVVRKCDLHQARENEKRIRRNEEQDFLMGESLEDYYAAVEELPYIGMAEVEKMEPCSLEIGGVEANLHYSPKYVWQGQLYQNGSIIRLLLKDGRKYIVEVQKLPDPSGGLFGGSPGYRMTSSIASATLFCVFCSLIHCKNAKAFVILLRKVIALPKM